VIESSTGGGAVILDDDSGAGTGLSDNAGYLSLSPGTGGVQTTLYATGTPIVADGITISAALNVTLGFAPTAGMQLTLINNAATAGDLINGTFSNLSQGGTYTASYLGTSYTFQTNYDGGAGNDLVLTEVQTSGPAVIGAYASGTAWNASYLSMLDAAGLGSSAASGQGFELASGANQLTTMLPWTDLTLISVAFSEFVNVSQTSLTLYNSSNTAIAPSGLIYNSTANIATWSFSTPLAAGKYVMDLAASSVTDTAGTELDGSWTTSVSTFANGSGNGTPGGDFNFYFNVLPGDANNSGSVTNGDLLITKLQVGAVSNSSNYLLDVNASGNITNGDVLLEKLQVGSNINSFSSPQLPPASDSQPAVASASQSATADMDSGVSAATASDMSSGVVVMAPANADAAPPASASAFASQPALVMQPDTPIVLDSVADVGDPAAGSLQLPAATNATAAAAPEPSALQPAVAMAIAATMPLLVADNLVMTSEVLATPAFIVALPTTDGVDALAPPPAAVADQPETTVVAAGQVPELLTQTIAVVPSIVVADPLPASASLPSQAGPSSALAPAIAGKTPASPVSLAAVSAVFTSLGEQPQAWVVLEPELLAALPAASTASVPAALPAALDRALSAATSANLPLAAATAHDRSLSIIRDLLRSRWSSLGDKTHWPARGA
jgi:hypothetical protein